MAAAALVMIAIGASLLRASSECHQVPMALPSHHSPMIEPREQELSPQPSRGSEVASGSEGFTNPLPRPQKPEGAVDAPTRGEPNERQLPRLQGHPQRNIPTLRAGASPDRVDACKTRITVFEKLFVGRQGFIPSPSELLDVGLCYQRLGNQEAARKWLTQASQHRETRARAMDALQHFE